MVTYKNIRIPKRGGGSRTQRVQVLASGKYKFVKNKPRSNPRPSRKARKVKTVARRRRRYVRKRRSTKSKKVPLSMIPSVLVPVGHMLGGNPPAGHTGLIKAFQSGDPQYIVNELKNVLPYETIGYTGDWKTPYNSFDFGIWIRNLGLIFGGALVHKAATALGVNRYMSKIPFIGKYLSI